MRLFFGLHTTVGQARMLAREWRRDRGVFGRRRERCGLGKRGACRALAIALALAVAAGAALGGALYGAVEETRAAVDRSRLSEEAAVAARGERNRCETALAQAQTEADAFREDAAKARALSQELAQAISDLQERDAEIARLSSLSDSRERRATLLSDANEQLQTALEAARTRAARGEETLLSAGDALEAVQEELAGLKSLYAEATGELSETKAALSRERERAAVREAELEEAYRLLTEAEEAYAGASALLGESDRSILEARRFALTKSNETLAAEKAAKAKQEELDRALSELTDMRSAWEMSEAEAEKWKGEWEAASALLSTLEGSASPETRAAVEAATVVAPSVGEELPVDLETQPAHPAAGLFSVNPGDGDAKTASEKSVFSAPLGPPNRYSLPYRIE